MERPLEFNISTIVNKVWSPSELKEIEPQRNDLLQSQRDLRISYEKCFSIRYSLMRSSFEGLHALWSPVASVPALTGADLQKALSCVFIEPDTQRKQFTESAAAESCKHTGFFRFTSSFANRSFTVDRAPNHVRVFLDATQISFPEQMVPSYVENNPFIGDVILDYVKNHADALFSYIPLLFFLFEADFKSSTEYFAHLENFIKNMKSQELTKVNSLKPKASKGWFSFGSSKPKEVQYSFVENVEFIDTYALQLPRGFKERFVSFSAKKDRFLELSKSVDTMTAAFLGENEELRKISEEMGCLPQVTIPDICPNGEVDGERSNEIRQHVGLLQQTCFTGVERGRDAHQYLKLLVAYTKQAEHAIISIENYFLDYLKLKRTLLESMPIINAPQNLVKGCPAYDNKSLFLQAAELLKVYSSNADKWEALFEDELSWATRYLQRSEMNICSAVNSYFSSTTLKNPFLPIEEVTES